MNKALPTATITREGPTITPESFFCRHDDCNKEYASIAVRDYHEDWAHSLSPWTRADSLNNADDDISRQLASVTVGGGPLTTAITGERTTRAAARLRCRSKECDRVCFCAALDQYPAFLSNEQQALLNEQQALSAVPPIRGICSQRRKRRRHAVPFRPEPDSNDGARHWAISMRTHDHGMSAKVSIVGGTPSPHSAATLIAAATAAACSKRLVST